MEVASRWWESLWLDSVIKIIITHVWLDLVIEILTDVWLDLVIKMLTDVWLDLVIRMSL